MKITLVRVFTLGLAGLAAGCSFTQSGNSLNSAITTSANQPTALAFASKKQFGNELSKSEKLSLSKAELKALEYGEAGDPLEWQGVSKGVSGIVVVSQLFRVGQSNCRRFSHKIIIKNVEDSTDGTACRRENGPWKLIR